MALWFEAKIRQRKRRPDCLSVHEGSKRLSMHSFIVAAGRLWSRAPPPYEEKGVDDRW